MIPPDGCRPHPRAGRIIAESSWGCGATRLTPGFMLSPAFAGWDINRCESFAPRNQKQIASDVPHAPHPRKILSPAFAGWDINRCESFAPRNQKQIASERRYAPHPRLYAVARIRRLGYQQM